MKTAHRDLAPLDWLRAQPHDKPCMLTYCRQFARAAFPLVLGVSIIAGAPTVSRAVEVGSQHWLDARALKSTDMPGAIKELQRLCFDAAPSNSWSAMSCWDLGLTLSAEGPSQDIPEAFRTFSYACDLYGDTESKLPCLSAGRLALGRADVVGVNREDAVPFFAEGCKGPKYGLVGKLHDKNAANCEQMAQAHQVGFGVPQDTNAATRYRKRACEAQLGDSCILLNVDFIEDFNAWIDYARADGRTAQERRDERKRLRIMEKTDAMATFCKFRSSPSPDACFWAGYMMRVQNVLLNNRTVYSQRRGHDLIKRSCALGNKRACEWQEGD